MAITLDPVFARIVVSGEVVGSHSSGTDGLLHEID
jgi:hypothetical protein